MVHLVEEAQESKAPIQGVADPFTVLFFPTVIALAVIGYLTTGDIKVNCRRLASGLPCAPATVTASALAAGIADVAHLAIFLS